MKTLSIVSHKGGAGKTCSAVLIAEELARRGFRVLMIDADRQRSAGLVLGVEGPAGIVLETQNPRLRYYGSAGLAIREVPHRARELVGLFDVAVADTPSLDDPLARAWLQQSHAALMVVSVEPLSIKTLDGAQQTLEALHQLNPGIRFLGMLPTLYDEQSPEARALLMELNARRPGGVLTPPIPLDAGLVHRAAAIPTPAGRTQADERTRAAYAQVVDRVSEALGLAEIYRVAEEETRPRWTPEAQRAASEALPAVAPPAAAAAEEGDRPSRPAVKVVAPSLAPPRLLTPARMAVAALVALSLLLGIALGAGWRSGRGGAGAGPVAATSAAR